MFVPQKHEKGLDFEFNQFIKITQHVILGNFAITCDIFLKNQTIKWALPVQSQMHLTLTLTKHLTLILMLK